MVPPPPPLPSDRDGNNHAQYVTVAANAQQQQSREQTQYQPQNENRPPNNHRVAMPYPPTQLPDATPKTITPPSAYPRQSVSVSVPNIISQARDITSSKVRFQSTAYEFSSKVKRTSPVHSLIALSPKVQPFTQDSCSVIVARQNDEFYPPTTTHGETENDDGKNEVSVHIFSPTQCLDESGGSSVTLLHSIFSPKFNAQSAKKKKKSSSQDQELPHRIAQEHVIPGKSIVNRDRDNHQSIFSPVSTGSSERARTDDGADDSAASEVSDEFSTIHAILRGDTIESIKKLVGLDEAHHPLQPKKGGVSRTIRDIQTPTYSGIMKGPSIIHDQKQGNKEATPINNVHDYTVPEHNKQYENDKVQSITAHNDNNDSATDDCTEAMLEIARRLSNNHRYQVDERIPSTHHDQSDIFTSPPGNHHLQHQHLGASQVTKTPTITTPIHENEFYTPSTSDKSERPYDDVVPRLSTMAPSPTSLIFDLTPSSVTGAVKKGLTPVREDDEGKADEDDTCMSKDNWDNVIGLIQSFDDSSGYNKDFFTPKGMTRQSSDNCDDYLYDDKEEEEFFSPLVLHSGHTPSNQHHVYNVNPSMMSTVQSSLTALDFHNESTHGDNGKNANLVPTEYPAKVENPSSLEYLDVKQDLQSLLKEAKILSPSNYSREPPIPHISNIVPSPTPVDASMHLSYSQDASFLQNPNSFHLHPASVSNLPPDALSVDFVKSCSSPTTLKTILGVLSDNNSTCATHKNAGKRGKQLRYPSLIKFAEKRLQKLMNEQDEHTKSEIERQIQSSIDGANKENVDPLSLLDQDNRVCMTQNISPVECINVLNDSHETDVKNEESKIVVNESIMTESLDMNLSESIFLLEDESFFWKQAVDNSNVEAITKIDGTKFGEIAGQVVFDKDTQTYESDDILDCYHELGDKFPSTIESHSRHAKEMNHRISQKQISAENLKCMNEQFHHQYPADTTNHFVRSEIRDSDFEHIINTLREETQRLRHHIRHLNQSAEITARQLQTEIAQVKQQHVNLSDDKETLEQELYKTRTMLEKAQREIARLQLLLDKKKEGDNSEKIQRIVESAKLANKALANALAVSEKDLADALAAKEKSERECTMLRDHSNKLEDKTSFLLSEMKKVTEELHSSHAYIDKLYAGLEASRLRSQEITKDFQRREKDWIESKREFTERIQKLESQIGSDSKHKVSMDAYLSVIKQTRYYKFETMKSQQTINFLKDQLRNIPKSITTIREDKPNNTRVPTTIKTSSQLVLVNDENVVQSRNNNARNFDDVVVEYSLKKDATAGIHQDQGKQLSRIAAVRAAGGRKGLSEQLKKARRFGEKQLK